MKVALFRPCVLVWIMSIGSAGCSVHSEPERQRYRAVGDDAGGDAEVNGPPLGWGQHIPCPSGDPLSAPMLIPMLPMPSLADSVLDSEINADPFVAGCIQEFNDGACAVHRASLADSCLNGTTLWEMDGGNGVCSRYLYAESFDCDALCIAKGASSGECRQNQPVVCHPNGATIDSAYCHCVDLLAGTGTSGGTGDGGTAGGDESTTGGATGGGETTTGAIPCEYDPDDFGTGTWGGDLGTGAGPSTSGTWGAATGTGDGATDGGQWTSGTWGDAG
ncbi:hypothetical protein [Paraliomyxa miuraensis]|uniref:hypothetical protein n=1 Tax=Paraliomyxa miuraensis TaxID=376150 RepID=UPI00224C81E4|nr:hypothetical protein [Paraliomyxa miuraensis]MCX4243137.1 hypothetical protein [Paraliomyxa miuraensis]